MGHSWIQRICRYAPRACFGTRSWVYPSIGIFWLSLGVQVYVVEYLIRKDYLYIQQSDHLSAQAYLIGVSNSLLKKGLYLKEVENASYWPVHNLLLTIFLGYLIPFLTQSCVGINPFLIPGNNTLFDWSWLELLECRVKVEPSGSFPFAFSDSPASSSVACLRAILDDLSDNAASRLKSASFWNFKALRTRV